MKTVVFAFALVGTSIALVAPLASQGGPPGGGRGKGAPAVPAGPMSSLSDGHPNYAGILDTAGDHRHRASAKGAARHQQFQPQRLRTC